MSRRPVLRRLLGVLAFALVCLLSNLWLPLQVPFLLAFGWLAFLSDVFPKLEWNVEGLGLSLTCLLALGPGTHVFLVRLARDTPGSDGRPRRWHVRWTLQGLSWFVLLFVGSIATVGLAHQSAWLLSGPIHDQRALRNRMSSEEREAFLRSLEDRAGPASQTTEHQQPAGIDPRRAVLSTGEAAGPERAIPPSSD